MVRYARFKIGGSIKKPKAASTWNEMTNTSKASAQIDEDDNDNEAQLALQAAATPVLKRPKVKSKVAQFAAKGLEDYDSSGIKITASPSDGIAMELQKLAPVQLGIEVVKDIPRVNKTVKKDKKKKLKATGAVAQEIEKIKKSHKGKLTAEEEKDLEEYVKKDQRREERRQKRIDERQTSKMCFNCRESGHTVADCPKVAAPSMLVAAIEHGTGICFKCGSTEHSVHRCRAKVPPGEYPYAKCFICGEMGHLSNQCVDNPRGLYPNGGCCGLCGSVEHYKRDCLEHLKMQGIEDIRLSTIASVRSGDDDNLMVDRKPPPPRKKGPKIVKF